MVLMRASLFHKSNSDCLQYHHSRGPSGAVWAAVSVGEVVMNGIVVIVIVDCVVVAVEGDDAVLIASWCYIAVVFVGGLGGGEVTELVVKP